MRLDTESLRALKLVSEVGNVTEVAQRLSLTQSAVSWKLRRLEERVGCPLLVREGRALRLTRHGQELLAYAERIIATHDAAVRRFRGSGLSGSIRLGTTDDLVTRQVAELAGRFSRAHPGVCLQIRVLSSLTLSYAFDAGELDLVVMPVERHEVRPGDRVLWQEPLQFAQSVEMVFEDRRPLPLITFGPGCFYGRIATALLDEFGIDHEPVLQSASIAGVCAAVSAGFGVALVNRSFMRADQRIWTAPPTLPEPPPVHYVLRAGPAPLDPAQQSLADALAAGLCAD